MFASIKIRRVARLGVVALVLASYAGISQAALSLSGTRVVFDGNKRSVSLVVRNPSAKHYAAQAWVNTEADDTTSAVPFIASPPLFRLEPGKDQLVQLNGLPNTLPQDRESLFYFNVQEIPQVDDTAGNVLNIALRTRIKLFYRPVNLKGSSVAQLQDLQWFASHINGKTYLKVKNPTPFHVSFVRLDVIENGKTLAAKNPSMVAPFSEQSFPVPGLKNTQTLQVVFSAINDFGAYTEPLTRPIQVAH